MKKASKKQASREINLDGVFLTIHGEKFTLTMEEIVRLSQELEKVVPPRIVTYPVIIKETERQPGTYPWPWTTWCSSTGTKRIA